MLLAPLSPGHPARPFTLLDNHGRSVSLAQLCQHGPVLLVFFQSPHSPTCRAWLAELAKHQTELERQGLSVAALNPVDWEDLHWLARDLTLPFSLLHDPFGKIARHYRAQWPLRVFINLRRVYQISQGGMVERAWRGFPDIEAILANPSTR